MSVNQTQKIMIDAELPFTYVHEQAGEHKTVIIFLHGYTDKGSSFLRRAFPNPDPRFEIVAPNGVFPTPVKVDSGWKEAYAWYFFDMKTQTMVISPTTAINAIAKLMIHLGLEDRKKIVVGFSQGGFLMPRLLPALKNVKKVIGIGCGYRVSDYPDNLNILIDGIHGDTDAVVPYLYALEGHQQLSEKKLEGNFVTVKGLAHTMNDEAREIFKKMVLEAL